MPTATARFVAVGCFAVLHVLPACRPAAAAPALGPVVRVNEGFPGCSFHPQAAPLRSGGFVAAWSDEDATEAAVTNVRLADRQGLLTGSQLTFPGRVLVAVGPDPTGGASLVWTNGAVLSRQRLARSGEPLGPETPLPVSLPGSAAAAAFAPDGRLALVSTDAQNRPFARWFALDGSPLTAEIVLDVPQPHSFGLGATIDAAGRLVAAWTQQVDPIGHTAVRYRRIDPSGVAGNVVEVSRPALPLAAEYLPQVAGSDDGGVTVAWIRNADLPSDRGTWFRRFDAADLPLAPPAFAGSSFEPPSLASDGHQIVLATGRGAVYLLPIAPQRAEVSLHPEISVAGGNESPTLTFLDDGRLAVLWNTFTPSVGIPSSCDYDGIFGRVVDLDPDLPAPQPALQASLGASTGGQTAGPEIAVDPDGGWVALWQAAPCGAVKSRAFDAAGRQRGAEAVLSGPICGTPDLALVPLAEGGFMAAWASGPGSAISLQRLDATGHAAGALATFGPLGSHRPRLAPRVGGGFLLGWAEPGSEALRLQAFGAGGAEGGTVELAATSTAGDCDLAGLPDGGFAAAWVEDAVHVVARRLGPTGLPVTDRLVASSDDMLQSGPHVAPDVAGGFAAAWTAVVNTAPANPARLIPTIARLRRFTAGGQPRGGVLDVDRVQDMQNTFGDTLTVDGLAASRDGVLWLLLDRRMASLRRMRGLAVLDGVVAGPETELSDGWGAAPGGVAATLDGCSWLAAWWNQETSASAYEAAAARIEGGCLAAPPSLRLGEGGRFRAQISWRTPPGNPAGSGTGRPIPLVHDSGAYWFFAPENPELMLKVLDGRGVNGSFWVFYATLTDVALDLGITDTWTGRSRTYHKPQGRIQSFADVQAFPAAGAAAAPTLLRPAVLHASEETETAETGCTPTANALCLSGRFRVGVRFTDPRNGVTSDAMALPLTVDSGSFWFFAPENLELLVKMVDGRPVNDRFWFFHGGLSDVRYDITVTDTTTGAQRIYHHRRGALTSSADTAAFP